MGEGGATYVSLVRREMDSAGWRRFDEIVHDDREANMINVEFVEQELFSRDRPYGEIRDLGAGEVAVRERADERILVHVMGLVLQDVAICRRICEKAAAKGVGVTLPPADK